MTTIITVQRLDPPKSEKGPWGLQDTNGKWWKIFARDKMAAAVEEGATFTVDAFKEDVYNGKTSYVLQKLTKAAGPGHAIIPKTSYQNSKNPRDELHIFCTALLKSGLESGQISWSVKGMAAAYQEAAEVYRLTQTQPYRKDLDDYIPI